MDIEKVKRAKMGDKTALLELIMHQKNEYYKLAMVYLRSESDALDAIQEMILVLYSKMHTLKKPESFYSWSKTILVNQCKQTLKKRKRFISIDDYDTSDTTDLLYQCELSHDLAKALSHLNAKQREVIALRYDLDMSYEEISKVLSVPLGTVKSRLSKGIAELKGFYEGGR